MSEDLYRILFDLSPDAIVLVDGKSGEILRFNRRAYVRLGYTAEEFKELGLAGIDIYENKDDVLAHLAAITQTSDVTTFDTRHQRKDGSIMNVQVVGRAFLNGKTVLCQAIWKDVTEEKRVAEALEDERKEAVDLAQSLAHDLKAPMRTITRQINSLIQRKAYGIPKSEVQVLLASIEQISGILADLEEWATTGINGSDMRPLRLEDVLALALGSISADLRDTHFRVDIESDLPIILGNKSLLSRVFQNLIDNANKYGGDPPSIKIQADRQGSMWLVSVTDNGPGIEERFREQVFQPLRRLHTWWEVPGSGLGLAACRRIIRLHGGKIWVEEGTSGGASFKFTLPGVNDG